MVRFGLNRRNLCFNAENRALNADWQRRFGLGRTNDAGNGKSDDEGEMYWTRNRTQ
jgi:hypothetical protein